MWALARYFGMKFLWIKRQLRVDNLDGRPLPKEKEPRLKRDLIFILFKTVCKNVMG